MTDLAHLPHQLDETACVCRAVIETPKGSRDKFDFDPDLGAFFLKKRLPEGMSFPLDFGFVPSTRAEDGDPLDIMVLADDPLPMGLVVTVRLIGVIEAEQMKSGRLMRNDRLIGVSFASRLFGRVYQLDDLGEAFTQGLSQFWVAYNLLEGGSFRVLRIADGPGAARTVGKATLGEPSEA
jgi:inorganic pyrophosphatase